MQKHKPSDVIVPEGRRELNPETVKVLTNSIRAFGLLHPIEVRLVDDKPVLVHGRHRCEALIALGDEPIEMRIRDGDDAEAMAVEAVENLHRSDLTVMQRDEQNVRLVEVIKASPAETVSNKGGRGKKGAPSQAAEMTGQAKSTVSASIGRVSKILPKLWNALKAKRPHITRDELDSVAKMSSDEQEALFERLTAPQSQGSEPLPPPPLPPFDQERWFGRMNTLAQLAPDDSIRDWCEDMLEALRAKETA